MKKIIVIILLISMLLSFMIPIIANAEPDDLILSSGKALEALGVLVGNNEGDLMLSNKLNRQDMIVLVSRLYKEENKAKILLVKPQFTDVTDAYEYYKPFIQWSVDKGLIKGMGNNEFGINKNVTAHQYMTVLLRVLGYEEESRLWNTVPDLAIKLGIMQGLNISPQTEVTRGQMAVMTFNTLKLTLKGSTLTLADKLNLKM